jgi:hypothetical protein
MADPAEASPALPSRLRLALGPALIALVVTLARLGLELKQAPGWLASREPGGPFAVLGIAWLPFFFGPWFALQIARATPSLKKRVGRLFSTLVVYGFLSRIPVFLITLIGLKAGWDTHHVKFAATQAETDAMSMGEKVLRTAIFQLGAWPLVFTTIAGGLAGLIALAIVRPRAAATSPAPG